MVEKTVPPHYEAGTGHASQPSKTCTKGAPVCNPCNDIEASVFDSQRKMSGKTRGPPGSCIRQGSRLGNSPMFSKGHPVGRQVSHCKSEDYGKLTEFSYLLALGLAMTWIPGITSITRFSPSISMS
jgi:hypothetical protein